jgi:hypothetical protein
MSIQGIAGNAKTVGKIAQSDKALINDLRCLRMHLTGFLNPEHLKVIQKAEERITTGGVSTPRAILPKPQNGKRITKKVLTNKYYFKGS